MLILVETCGDRGILVADLAAGDCRLPRVTGSNQWSPVVTGDEIGDEICAPKITKDLGEFMGVHERLGIGPPAGHLGHLGSPQAMKDHIFGDLGSSTMRYRIS